MFKIYFLIHLLVCNAIHNGWCNAFHSTVENMQQGIQFKNILVKSFYLYQ